MEGKKYLLILLLALFSTCLLGQNNKSIYNAYISGKMTKWKSAMDSVDALKQKTDKDLLDLINYQYGYIGWSIGSNKNEEAEKYCIKTLTIEPGFDWVQDNLYPEILKKIKK